MDRERLSKLMSLTASENDNEALAALRMANKMLSAEKMTWGEILAAGGPSIRIVLQGNGAPEEFYQAVDEWTTRKKRRS